MKPTGDDGAAIHIPLGDIMRWRIRKEVDPANKTKNSTLGRVKGWSNVRR